MYKSTVESDSTHRSWLPSSNDYGNRFCGLVCRIRYSEPYTSDTETLQHHTLIFVGLSKLSAPQRIPCGTKQRAHQMKKQLNNGLPHGTVLKPSLFNIYTNAQSIHYEIRSLIYADDLYITAQYQSFNQVEKQLKRH